LKTFDKSVIRAVNEARDELAPYLNAINFEKISKFNYSYIKYKNNPTKHFIDHEIVRYYNTADYIYKKYSNSNLKILDIGFFIPVLPIALSKLGYKVSSCEMLEYYNGAFDEIIETLIPRYDIKLFNIDITRETIENVEHEFDIVLFLAFLGQIFVGKSYYKTYYVEAVK